MCLYLIPPRSDKVDQACVLIARHAVPDEDQAAALKAGPGLRGREAAQAAGIGLVQVMLCPEGVAIYLATV